MYLIQQKVLWFVHIPFGSFVKFQFVAQSLLKYLPRPVMPCLELFLSKLSNNFLFLFCCVSFSFNIVGPNTIVLCFYKKNSSFSFKVSFSLTWLCLLVWNFVSLSLEISIQFFPLLFPFLFQSYCSSVDLYVVCEFLVTVIKFSPLFLCNLWVLVLVPWRYPQC